MFMERSHNKDIYFEVDDRRKQYDIKVDYTETRFLQVPSPNGMRRECVKEYNYDDQCIYSQVENSFDGNCTTPW